jgi:hypothetical protein
MLLSFVPTLAMAQSSGSSGVDPMAGTGMVRNNVYTNTFFGFSYKFPTTWKVLRGPDNIAQAGGCGQSACTLLALQAESGVGRLELKALPLAGASPRDVLQKAAAQEEALGLKPTSSMSEFQSGGWTFYRLDYEGKVSRGELLESLVATSSRGSALLITVITDSRKVLQELAGSITVGEGAVQQGQAVQ